MPCICLSVYVFLLATLRENYWTDLHENFTTDVTMHKNELNFESHPLPDLDTGIFWRILQHYEIGHFFHNLAYISKESNRIFMKILSRVYPLTTKFPLNYASNPDPESVSGYGLPIPIRFSLAEVWLLLFVTVVMDSFTASYSALRCFIIISLSCDNLSFWKIISPRPFPSSRTAITLPSGAVFSSLWWSMLTA